MRHVREAVRFADGIRSLEDRGVTRYLELGPDGTLTALSRACLPSEGRLVTPALRSGTAEELSLITAVSELHVTGHSPDWSALLPVGRRVDLPTYAFQRQRYWLESAEPAAHPDAHPADSAFWSAVEGGDIQRLADRLGLDQTLLDPVVPALSAWHRDSRQQTTAQSWQYRELWRPLDQKAAGSLSGTWLLAVCDESTVDEAVVESAAAVRSAITAAGGSVTMLHLPAGADREAVAQAVGEALGQDPGPVRVLSLLGLTRARHPVHPEVPAGLALNTVLLQTLSESAVRARLWMATRGAVSVGAADRLDHALQATTWGFGRTAALEYPDRWAGLVDLPHRLDKRALTRLSAALADPEGESELAVRESGVFARRLVRATGAGHVDAPTAFCRPNSTALITGGTGTIGAHMARWLAQEGVQHLLLVSRRGPEAPGADLLRADLEALDVQVTVLACDIADRAALDALLASIPEDRPLSAVFHTAGVLDDGVLASMDARRYAAVLRSKVDAAVNLHEATRHLDLSAFVLFSSIAGVLGSVGQAGYAAGNAFLDALARHRRAQGLAAVSVAWGPWADGGMAADAAVETRMRRGGLAPMDPRSALTALAQVLGQDDACTVVSDIDWSRFGAGHTSAASGLLLSSIPEAAAPVSIATGTTTGGSLSEQLDGLGATERKQLLLRLVRRSAATALGHPGPESIEPTRTFQDCGIDSLTAVELRNSLASATGLALPTTLVFDHPTPRALADHLGAELLGDESAAAESRQSAGSVAGLHDEPVAIVAMGCRLPGRISSPEELWELLAAGQDAITPFPDDRGWDLDALYDPDPESARPGTTYVHEGGFVLDAADFDAQFFGISPREALAVDPQQRLLLEVAWETVERAGIDPRSLRGSRSGLFIGCGYQGYDAAFAEVPEDIRGHLLTGGAGSVASGRVAYTLGLEGPAVTLDTACSSSLVAVHLAAQALRSGECDLALAGGVTVMSTPGAFVEFSRQRGLAPDGRCKAFAEAADGTAWAEGAGMLLLERLSDAQRNGHTVLAVVSGSAVNQDGGSNGLTAPNGASQQRVIRQALAGAGLSPTDVDVVEAHGTGTTLGDPIEAQALLATYGQGREPGRPLWLGSVKSNIGHTQAAAGAAGLIKMVLAMRHGVMPRTLHVDAPSSHVDWSAGEMELLTEQREWPREAERPRRAAVSAFGISGTNAHVIIEQLAAPAREAAVGTDGAPSPAQVPWVVSGRGEAALRTQAAQLVAHIEQHPGLSIADLGYSLAATRSTFENRAVVIGDDRDSLLDGLRSVSRGESTASTTVGAVTTDGAVALLFAGQGSQRPGMGRELHDAHPVFADAFDAVCARMDGELGRPLREVVFGEDAELLNRTEFAQPALFALEVALFRLVESWGVRADYLLGHSIGELAAAHVAGVWSLEDACRLVAARGRLMQALPAGGAMVSLQASEAEVLPLLEGRENEVGLAAVNGPGSVVVSGEETAVELIAAHFRELERKVARLRVSHAFHSPLMEPMLEEFRQVALSVAYGTPRVAIVSHLTGEAATPDELCSAEYWVRQVRDAVRFADAVQALEEREVGRFLELGPDGTLTALAQACLDSPGLVLVPALRKDRPEAGAVLSAMAEMFTHGTDIDWTPHFPGAARVDLPTYAFQHRRYWPRTSDAAPGDLGAVGLTPAGHPLLGAAVSMADSGSTVFTGRLSARSQPWLAEHVIADAILLPGTAFLELAAHAADQLGCGQVEELTLEAPLVLPERGAVRLQLVVAAADDEGRRSLSIHSRPDDPEAEQQPWTRHAGGSLLAEAATASADLTVWPPADATPVTTEGLYERLAGIGFDYGPVFSGLRAAWQRGDELFVEAGLPEEAVPEARRFGLHPALLDSVLHAVGASPTAQTADETGRGRIPFAWTGATLHAWGASLLRARLSWKGPDTVGLDLADASGRPVATIGSLTLRALSADTLADSRPALPDVLYRVDWVPAPVADDRAAAVADVVDISDVTDLAALAGRDGDVPAHVVVRVDHSDGDPARTVAGRVLALLQGWLAHERFGASRLVLVTEGAVAVDHGAPDPVAASVWGLVRAARVENPGRFVLVDMDGAARSWSALDAVLASGEPEAAVRDGAVCTPRLARATARSSVLEPPGNAETWRLDIAEKGTLDGLALTACPEVTAELGAGQVRVSVRAAGVNFRDVLNALGMYPGDARDFGLEGAGVVTEVGPGVVGTVVGDRVMGMFSGAFGPVAVADARTVVRIPAGWSFAQAASVPIV
uniref:type I polyketide synthase n=1 Tax=Wenjunlia tyrosinilytica TaxID=1544741 RepID=UPI0016656717